MTNRRTFLLNMFISGILVMAMMWLLYWIKGYVPFGDHSLATMDADFQYLDFYAYMKDVLLGRNNIDYSFTKTIGGPCIGIFSYYLASPFNLLLIFFKKSQLIVFMELIISMKLALAASTCSYYLNRRFASSGKNPASGIMNVFFAVSYALGQYSIAQASNCMWLDGVYMLPLILLGVYRVVREAKTTTLSITVALSILFNWYTGGINCLFAIIWLIFEYFIMKTEGVSGSDRQDKFWKVVGRAAWAMFIGVLISAVLFLPTIGAMKYSTRGKLEFQGLTDMSLLGNVASVIEAYSIGAMSSKGVVSLYCGSLAIIGCIGIFIGKTKTPKQKLVRALMLFVVIMSFFWTPLCTVFSLFKSVGSYWYRYSYIGIITIIFLAYEFFFSENIRHIWKRVVISVGVFALYQIVLNRAYGWHKGYYIIATIIFLTAVTAAVLLSARSRRIIVKRAWMAILCMLFVLETGADVSLQMDNYHRDNGDRFREYTVAEEELVSNMKNYDPGIYRVNQTNGRNLNTVDIARGENKTGENGKKYLNDLRANYDESMAYNYWAIAGYTSSPDTNTLEFLERIGYRMSSENMNTVNMALVGADSLLGVRYVLSAYDITGLDKVKDIPDNSRGIGVYENPYCLPMAFVYNSGEYKAEMSNNPFEYLNGIYSELLGRRTELFIPLKYDRSGDRLHKIEYKLYIPDGNYAVYGNIPWNFDFGAILSVNKTYKTRYAKWLSPSVFDIPVQKGDKYGYIKLASRNEINIVEDGEQFYALNLDEFKKVTDELSQGAADKIDIKNGSADVQVTAQEGQSLLISIPYSDGWEIRLNGERIEPDLLGNCLYSIKLADGENTVQMKFHVKYLGLGIGCSVLGIFMLIMTIFAKKRKK